MKATSGRLGAHACPVHSSCTLEWYLTFDIHLV